MHYIVELLSDKIFFYTIFTAKFPDVQYYMKVRLSIPSCTPQSSLLSPPNSAGICGVSVLPCGSDNSAV